MDASLISLLPPALTLLIGFSTKSIKWALRIGIITSAAIAGNYSFWAARRLLINHLLEVTEIDHVLSWSAFCQSERLFIFIFLLTLGMIIAMIERSGDAKAYAQVLRHKLSGKKSAERASLSFSMSLFVDDYLNVITTTSIMPMMTDLFKIPRIKVAFLTIALAGPLCTLVPISSWGAPIGLFITNAGIAKSGTFTQITCDPFLAFAQSIPFIFQSIFMILSGWAVVSLGISYGIIGRHEQNAGMQNHEQDKKLTAPIKNSSSILARFLSPLAVMFFSIFGMIFYTGGAWFLGGSHSILKSFSYGNLPASMMIGSFAGLATVLVIFIGHKKRSALDAASACWAGVKEMSDSIMVLILAWVFAAFLNGELGTGHYLATKLLPLLSLKFLPVATFLLGAFMSFALGSSWATMSILFPIIIPMVPTLMQLPAPLTVSAAPIIFPLIGAIISGAVAGSSMSPMADLLLMASKNTKINHMEYVYAQMQYLLPTALSSALAFTVAGMTAHTLPYAQMLALSMTTGACANVLMLLCISAVWNRKRNA